MPVFLADRPFPNWLEQILAQAILCFPRTGQTCDANFTRDEFLQQVHGSKIKERRTPVSSFAPVKQNARQDHTRTRFRFRIELEMTTIKLFLCLNEILSKQT